MSACPTCKGRACEYGCGVCQYINAGPDSHRVCKTCGGTGQQGDEPAEHSYGMCMKKDSQWRKPYMDRAQAAIGLPADQHVLMCKVCGYYHRYRKASTEKPV